jgi:hypothetical protein
MPVLRWGILLALPLMLLGCGGQAPEGANSPSASVAAPTAESAPAKAQADAGRATGASKSAAGQCAVDVKDGAPYGRIVGQETDLINGDKMYRIQGQSGTIWNKKSTNVRVVACP